jgi:hypothetical protein
VSPDDEGEPARSLGGPVGRCFPRLWRVVREDRRPPSQLPATLSASAISLLVSVNAVDSGVAGAVPHSQTPLPTPDFGPAAAARPLGAADGQEDAESRPRRRPTVAIDYRPLRAAGNGHATPASSSPRNGRLNSPGRRLSMHRYTVSCAEP